MARPEAGTYRCRITAKDIREGKPKCIADCPGARAIKRRFKGFAVSVCDQIVLIGPLKIKAPAKLGSFVRNYDFNLPTKPTSFVIVIKAPRPRKSKTRSKRENHRSKTTTKVRSKAVPQLARRREANSPAS